MSSSVLRNVIQPKNGTLPAAAGGESAALPNGTASPVHAHAHEDMESVLGALIENAPVAMAMFDAQMRYMLANRSWIEEFSLQGMQPLLGRSQYDVFPGMHPGWRQVYDRALQGHVVRSEHDALSGPDGRRVVYRWEVRPWRRKKDAGVGGLMVTCEKFGNAAALQPAGAAPQEAGAPPAAPVAEAGELAAAPEKEATPVLPPLPASTLPMVLVDARGVIQQTNEAAAELGLARGIQEGVSAFWDVYADVKEAGRVQLLWGLTLEKLASECKEQGWLLEVPAMQCHSFSHLETLPPQRWLVTHSTGHPSGRYLALQLPSAAQPAAPAKPQPVPVPNLPAIAHAVAAIANPPGAEPSGNALEMRRLQDELARARQELRTLHEAERLFTQRESRIRQYMDSLPCGVLVLNELGSPVYQNEPVTKLLGRPVGKEDTVEDWLAAACPTPEHREEVTTLWREDVWRRQLTRVFSLATDDGLLKELEFQPGGLPGGGLLVCIQDATERCRQEEQLRATEAKFRTLLHEVPVPALLLDKSGAVFEVNHLAELLLGWSKADLRRQPLDAWLRDADVHARRLALKHLQETGNRSTSLEAEVQTAEGETLPVTMTLAQVLDSQGTQHCTIQFLQKQVAPAAAAPVLGRAASPLAANPLGFVQAEAPDSRAAAAVAEPIQIGTETVAERLLSTNVNGRIREITPRGMELLGLDETTASGRALHLHFRPSDPSGFYTQLVQLAQTPEEVTALSCFHLDGRKQPCRAAVVALGGGGYDFELTEHRELPVFAEPEVAPQAAAQIQASSLPGLRMAGWPVADLSREKLLLSETHHRIKNHLQIISSLLNLESNTTSNTGARDALRSSQNRVRAIAELHQHLYQMALGTAGSFSDFAAGLVLRLRECYQVPVDKVAVTLGLGEGLVQQEWLMPLALTLNETLSNSFEHAFPADRQGSIQVDLSFTAQEGCLTVRDDGVGLPTEAERLAGVGLGLKILTVFAEQMRGRLSFDSGNSGGTEIRLRFPIAYADI